MTRESQRAIIHVDMDAFYASVEVHDQPELAGKPVLVGGAGNRGVVAAASYEARRFGVFSAMPMMRARRLCPTAVVIRPRLARYREVSAQIFAVFHELTPLVEGLSLDEAFLDVTGSLRLHGDIEDIGRLIRDRIKERTGLQASIGMAHSKFLAKLASDHRKPAGFVHVHPGEVQAFLDPMPIRRLWGIGRKTEPRLRKRGILTFGQLRRADENVLAEVLGNRTGHFLRLVRGEDERLVQAAHEDKSISHEITFDTDVTDPRELRAELLRQSEAVMRRVRDQHLAARCIHLKIRDQRFRTASRSRTLVAATASSRTCYQVAKGLLLRWLEEHRNTPVRLLGVGTSRFEPLDAAVGELDGTLDEITRRYGDAMITRGLALREKPKTRD
ncbi:MAG: DNA polymerase IV [Xanthomonadales bacterium]|nr:DNA polymerase IV [Xanthomonadales bacterium]